MLQSLKSFLIINIGLLLVAMEINFIMIPNNLVTGGVAGLAIIINHMLPQLSVGAIMLICNIVLFILCFLIIGPDFGTKTIYCSFMLSFLVWLLQAICPVTAPLMDDTLAQLMIAVFLSSTGMALIFKQNGSTGGTDIIAKMLNKFFGIGLGKGVLLSDISIILFSMAIFGFRLGVYGLIGILLNGLVIDYILKVMSTNKEVVIITNDCLNIKGYILDTLGRGATIYQAKGAYTDIEKEVLRTVLPKNELLKLKKFIKSVDSNAFITVNDINETIGEGYLSL
jgi:uncharacterized membrane-anchored protein YitT (DUF2179 family)